MSSLKDQLIQLGLASNEAESSDTQRSKKFNSSPTNQRNSKSSRSSHSTKSSTQSRSSHSSRSAQGSRSQRNHSSSNFRSARGSRSSSHDQFDQQKTNSMYDRTQQFHREPPKDPKEVARLIKELFIKARMPFPPKGINRFYFERSNGAIDYLDVDDHGAYLLQSGRQKIVEDDRGHLCIIPRNAFNDLLFLDPTRKTTST